ncbi:YdbH domain-containing protein [Pseudomonas sp. NCCP-436]|uniref:intermembrane phospholipid transport protein YdbH family protein n=1 Tax=Pseudomonas sp. NCCP-436 TaxID=2842481 RepID=UPI001C7F9031|nr:YdbH domain-containing protein [Pseudomonas sp. NCCP-436]GIZ11240.1 hypothetical protein NCCP436_06560 [Pseudomonas sp. NCCP-436]
MSHRRVWLSVCIAIPALLLLLAGYIGHRLQQMLLEQHMALDWQRLTLSWRGVQLHEASLVQRSEGELQAHADRLELYWLATGSPRYRVHIHNLQLHWQPAPDETRTASSPDTDLRPILDTLPWLPRQIDVSNAEALLPCHSGYCTLRGNLGLRQQDDALLLRLRLLRDSHSATLEAQLQGLGNAQTDARKLQAALHLDEHQQLNLRSDLSAVTDALRWQGVLLLEPLQEIDWVARWLAEWTSLDLASLPATPRQAGVGAHWQLQLPASIRGIDDLLAARGWLRIDGQLPIPWPLPGIGLVSGELKLDLHNTGDRWQARQLHGKLQLDSRDMPWQAALPEGLQTQLWQIDLQPRPETADSALALQLQVNAQGPLTLQAQAELALEQSQDWQLDVQRLQLRAHSAHVQLGSERLEGLQVALDLSGSASTRQLQLQLGDSSRASLQHLQSAELELLRSELNLAGLEITGTTEAPKLNGPLQLRSENLNHPQLLPQGWGWQGRLTTDDNSQKLDGTLQADSGLNLALKLDRTSSGLHLKVRLDELFLRAGNPLAQTLSAWPPLLNLDNGRLHAEASLQLTDRPLQLRASLNARGLAGVYDRSSLSGVDADLLVQLSGNQIRLELPDLNARQIDPGIVLGPLRLQARYQADLQRPTAGRLSLQQANLGILKGSLSLEPASWTLDRESLLLPLKLSGLDLAELFRVYPAEGLEGSGLLDGNLPLRLGDSLSIEQGLIEARAPGGRLRFNSPRIRAMGQANPGMKLVTDALEDFHYDLLSSSLEYDPSGTLRLGMRLHGQNPDIEKGRPIHFNINLEEDIPTLLASLQLTDKVSDIIRQRIQQRMRQRVPDEPKE